MLINYNWMPTIADHCIDFPIEFYNSCGISRMHNHPNLQPENVLDNDIVFVKTDEIFNGNFQYNILPQIRSIFTLISGISSHCIGSNSDSSYIKILHNDKVKYWFCTNPPNHNSNKIIPLPIGFEELERDGGNQQLLNHFLNNHKPWNEKLNMIYLPYHDVNTNIKRRRQIDFLKSFDFVHVETSKKTFDKYLEKMNMYKYIICLPGSGYDTHRNYESLLVGSIPLMLKTPLQTIFNYYSLPCKFIDSFSYKFLQKILNNKNDKPDDDHVRQFLQIDYHSKRIIKHAKN